MESPPAIETRKVSFGYENRVALTNIVFSACAGEFVALIGPNGSGKTTLLKVLLGLLQPSCGTILLFNEPLSSYAPKERAKTIAYVSQQPALSFPLTVSELVGLGRYPHSSRFQPTRDDRSVVEFALQQANAQHLAARSFTTLSGGEQQKVLIARALAQSARVLLLDEPTLHLDLYYQLQILAALKKLSIEKQITVITVLHDVNLISLFADKALLLSGGTVRAFGPVTEVINEANVRDLLKVDMTTIEDSKTGARCFVPRGPFSIWRNPK